jgi:hypothetical protein
MKHRFRRVLDVSSEIQFSSLSLSVSSSLANIITELLHLSRSVRLRSYSSFENLAHSEQRDCEDKQMFHDDISEV